MEAERNKYHLFSLLGVMRLSFFAYTVMYISVLVTAIFREIRRPK
jgi:hypothetical protein